MQIRTYENALLTRNLYDLYTWCYNFYNVEGKMLLYEVPGEKNKIKVHNII